MTPARFRWGIILITIGVLLLLQNIDILPNDIWLDLAILFPILLIAVGIEKIFTRTRLQFISYLTSIALFGIAMYLAFHYRHDGGGYFSTSTHQIDGNSRVEVIRAELDLDKTNLTIRDSGRDLIYGRFERFTRKPDIDYTVVDDTAIIEYVAGDLTYLGGAIKISGDSDNEWYVRFSEDTPLLLNCSGRESDMHMNFATTPLRRLSLEADDSYIYLKLGDLEPLVTVDVRGEGSSLKLRVPEGIGLRVIAPDYDHYLERLGLTRVGERVFTTAGYDTLMTRVELDIDDDLSSFSVDFF